MQAEAGATLYLIRHAESAGNVAAATAPLVIPPAALGTPLTLLGARQARALARALRPVPAAAVISSDLLRARQTAERLAAGRGLAVRVELALRERERAALRGWSDAELRQLAAAYARLSPTEQEAWRRAHPPEEPEAVLARVIPALRAIAAAHRDETALVVSHGGAMRLLLAHLGYAPAASLAIENTGYIQLLGDGEAFAVGATVGVHLRDPGPG